MPSSLSKSEEQGLLVSFGRASWPTPGVRNYGTFPKKASGDGSLPSTHNFVSTSWFPTYKHSVFLWGLGPVRNENLSTGCSCLHQFLSTVKYLSSDSSCLPTPAVYSVSCPQLSAVNIVPVYSSQLSTDIIPEDRISHKLWNRFRVMENNPGPLDYTTVGYGPRPSQ